MFPLLELFKTGEPHPWVADSAHQLLASFWQVAATEVSFVTRTKDVIAAVRADIHIRLTAIDGKLIPIVVTCHRF